MMGISRNQTAFTLIELTVTMTILALLAMAALIVLSRLKQVRTLGITETHADDSNPTLLAALRRDLLHGVRYRNTPSRLDIDTLFCLDEKSSRPRHLPTKVSYVIMENPQGLLLRIQAPMEHQRIKECAGFQIQSILVGEEEQPDSQWHPLPQPVKVTMTRKDGSTQSMTVEME